MMTMENYGWKLAGVVEGRLRPEIEHKGFALRVVPSWCNQTDMITIAVTYHGHEFVSLGIQRSEIEDNLAEDRAIAYAESLLEDPLIERLPEQFRQETKARVRQIEQEVARENHPVIAAIGRLGR